MGVSEVLEYLEPRITLDKNGDHNTVMGKWDRKVRETGHYFAWLMQSFYLNHSGFCHGDVMIVGSRICRDLRHFWHNLRLLVLSWDYSDCPDMSRMNILVI